MSVERKDTIRIKKSARVFIILNNTVDEDMQSMLRPLNLMQNISLFPKYRIKNNLITPNNWVQNFLMLCNTAAFLAGNIYNYLPGEIRTTKNIVGSQNISNTFDFFFNCTGIIMNCAVNLLQTKKNVELVLTIQNVHRIIDNKFIFKRFIIGNWISFVIIVGFSVMFIIINFLSFSNLPFYAVGFSLTLICFDANVVYAIRLIRLFVIKVGLWNEQLLITCSDCNDKILHERLLESYLQIFKCYEIYKRNFHQMVLFNVIGYFCHTLIHFEILIQIFQTSPKLQNDDASKLLVMLMIYLWATKCLILQVILCLQCEAFYIVMEKSQDHCALVLSSDCSDEDKKLCKNIQRVYRSSFSKMSLCSLFYVDVCLLLHLFELLANYIIVLLQFAFL